MEQKTLSQDKGSKRVFFLTFDRRCYDGRKIQKGGKIMKKLNEEDLKFLLQEDIDNLIILPQDEWVNSKGETCSPFEKDAHLA